MYMATIIHLMPLLFNQSRSYFAVTWSKHWRTINFYIRTSLFGAKHGKMVTCKPPLSKNKSWVKFELTNSWCNQLLPATELFQSWACMWECRVSLCVCLWVCVSVCECMFVPAQCGVWGKDCEYRLWVRQWSEPIVVLLSCCIPKAEIHWFPIHHNIGRVVVKAARRRLDWVKALHIIAFVTFKHICSGNWMPSAGRWSKIRISGFCSRSKRA